jgi:hypothetical protein
MEGAFEAGCYTFGASRHQLAVATNRWLGGGNGGGRGALGGLRRRLRPSPIAMGKVMSAAIASKGFNVEQLVDSLRKP